MDPNLASLVAEILDFEQFAWKERPVFHTLNQAQHALSTLRLELETYNQSGVGTVPIKLQWWEAAFEEFRKNNAELLTTRECKRGVALMELQRQYVAIEISVFDAPPGTKEDPLRWDAHTDAFREMIHYAELAMEFDNNQHAAANTFKGPQFHMHTGVVPVLYGIIHKCREPSIRRQAIALMARSQRVEGIWDSQAVLAVALKAMAIEEQGQLLASSADIPAEARVRRIAVLPVLPVPDNHDAYSQARAYKIGYEIVGHAWAWEDAQNFLGTSPH